MPKRNHRYRGINIYRNAPGHRLRWFSIAPSLAADTLAGMKALIRETVDR